MTLHSYTSQPMSLPSIKFLYLRVSEIQVRQDYCSRHQPTIGENNTQPGQYFKGQGHYGKVKGHIKVTP